MPVYPKQVADGCLKRARQLLRGAQRLPTGKQDLYRAALVMGVAALDAYMHALIISRVIWNRGGGGLPRSMLQLDVPFRGLADLAENWLDARRRGVTNRPWGDVKKVLQDRLLVDTFQSPDQLARGLALAGVQKGWKHVRDVLEQPGEDLASRLSPIIRRRNQIVHEGDFRRQQKPRRLKRQQITIGYVNESLDLLERLIAVIDKVVT
jgi:hypothetical protein